MMHELDECIDRLSMQRELNPASLKHGDEWLWIWNPLDSPNSIEELLEEDLFSNEKF